MSERQDPRSPQEVHERWRAAEEPLRPLDSQLNIFALANGMDLVKNPDSRPGRLLQWYRDGLERGIRIEPAGDAPGRYTLWAVAWKDEGGERRERREAVTTASPAPDLESELRSLLARGVDAANAFPREDTRR